MTDQLAVMRSASEQSQAMHQQLSSSLRDVQLRLDASEAAVAAANALADKLQEQVHSHKSRYRLTQQYVLHGCADPQITEVLVHGENIMADHAAVPMKLHMSQNSYHPHGS